MQAVTKHLFKIGTGYSGTRQAQQQPYGNLQQPDAASAQPAAGANQLDSAIETERDGQGTAAEQPSQPDKVLSQAVSDTQGDAQAASASGHMVQRLLSLQLMNAVWMTCSPAAALQPASTSRLGNASGAPATLPTWKH